MSFKFIANTNTAFTAAEATQLNSISLGGIFRQQTKSSSFQLGNTGTSSTNFWVQASGVESAVTANVEFSTDGLTWTSAVGVSGIAAGMVSPLVRVRYTPDTDDYTSSGTFLIRVDEV